MMRRLTHLLVKDSTNSHLVLPLINTKVHKFQFTKNKS